MLDMIWHQIKLFSHEEIKLKTEEKKNEQKSVYINLEEMCFEDEY